MVVLLNESNHSTLNLFSAWKSNSMLLSIEEYAISNDERKRKWKETDGGFAVRFESVPQSNPILRTTKTNGILNTEINIAGFHELLLMYDNSHVANTMLVAKATKEI
jgi:hypothetical protein